MRPPPWRTLFSVLLLVAAILFTITPPGHATRPPDPTTAFGINEPILVVQPAQIDYGAFTAPFDKPCIPIGYQRAAIIECDQGVTVPQQEWRQRHFRVSPPLRHVDQSSVLIRALWLRPPVRSSIVSGVS